MKNIPDFSKAKETYRKSAFVQNKMSQTLCKICAEHFGLNYGKIFEIGSGTGLLTERIVKNFNFCELILNDLTENFTGYNYSFLKGDASVLQLPKNCDLIISGACFQWICNVESFFTKLKKSLNEKGILAFSSFGKDNFYEFKSVENLGLDYCNYAEILSNCGYSIVEYEREKVTLYFKTPKDILRHISSTGAVIPSDKHWSKTSLKSFEKKYIELFGDEKGVTLTYNPLYILATVK